MLKDISEHDTLQYITRGSKWKSKFY
jgi:hypothetical protein